MHYKPRLIDAFNKLIIHLHHYIFNDLKRRAETILDENRNILPLNKRVSQADIDSLTNQMQHTLIRSVDAENAVNKKVHEMEDLVNQNDELTDEEKQAAIQVIEEHKMK